LLEQGLHALPVAPTSGVKALKIDSILQDNVQVNTEFVQCISILT